MKKCAEREDKAAGQAAARAVLMSSPREELLEWARSLRTHEMPGGHYDNALRALEVLADEHPYADFSLSDYEHLCARALAILRGEEKP